MEKKIENKLPAHLKSSGKIKLPIVEHSTGIVKKV